MPRGGVDIANEKMPSVHHANTLARAQTELRFPDDDRYRLKQAVKKGSLVPTMPRLNKRLAVIHKMEPQRIGYHIATRCLCSLAL
jgi:hypothetical protein